MSTETNEIKEIKKEETKKKTSKSSQTTKAVKVYNILSYIFVLWLVGLLGSDKDNKKVKFHVGQGMLVTILWAAILLINKFIIANIFVNRYTFFGATYTSGVSQLGSNIMSILNLIPLIFSIIGIINAATDREIELPLIGKYAFYK